MDRTRRTSAGEAAAHRHGLNDATESYRGTVKAALVHLDVVPRPARFCSFRTPLAQRPLAQKKPCQFPPGALAKRRAGAGVALGGHGVGARRVPVSVSKRTPDRQAPPPSRLSFQWPAEQPPGEKVQRSTRGHYRLGKFPGEFAPGPRSLTDIGARMSPVGGKAEVDFGRLHVCL